MKKVLGLIFLLFMFAYAEGESVNYAMYRDAKFSLPIEKEFITNLKPSNPDDLRTGGYAKFRATLLYNDKGASKELEHKMDIIRSVILDVVSGFSAQDLVAKSGRDKFASTATASINAILTDSNIIGMTFGDIVVQPSR